MSGFIIILACNIILFTLIRMYMDSSMVRDHGEHRLANVFILGMLAFWFFSGSVAAALFIEQAHTGAERFVYGAFGIITALPWALSFLMVLTDGASSSVVDSLYGTTREGVDEADLRKANELIRKGMRDEAIAELRRLRNAFPDSSNARFVLAALAEDENDYSMAAEHYREILQHCHDQLIPWTNAARALSNLLRNELNDSAAANHLDEEILTRNPDTHFQLTSGDIKPKKSKGKPTNARPDSRDRVDLNQARRLIARKETAKGLALFKRYLEAHPKEIRGHFDLVSLYEQHDRVDDAVRRLQYIIHEFGTDDEIWGKAVLRLASLRQTHEQDEAMAISLLETVAQRLKFTDQGRQARERLRELRAKNQAQEYLS